jgi:anti-sigma B factor antagonist
MFEIELNVREFGGQAIVALRGELDLGSTPAVASHLLAAVAACGPSVILDLADLDDICLAGLATLVRVREWVRESGGDLTLAAPRVSVRRVLQAHGLADIFSVYPSVEHAALDTQLAVFSGGPYRARCGPLS